MTLFTICKVLLQFIFLHTVTLKPLDAAQGLYMTGAVQVQTVTSTDTLNGPQWYQLVKAPVLHSWNLKKMVGKQITSQPRTIIMMIIIRKITDFWNEVTLITHHTITTLKVNIVSHSHTHTTVLLLDIYLDIKTKDRANHCGNFFVGC